MKKFMQTYLRKKPDGIDDEFISYYETFFDISLATVVEEILDAINAAAPLVEDEDWLALQTMNIPHYRTWMKLFKYARHPWPLIENTIDASGPPLKFVWINDSVNRNKPAEVQSDFMVGCGCSQFAYQECSPLSCKCPSEWEMENAYTNNGLLDPKFTGNIIIECNSKCDCSSSCPNRVVQNKTTRRYIVFKCSVEKGWGLKSTVDIPRGALIEEYVGEIITNEEAENRGLRDQQRGITYLFDLDAFVVADNDLEHRHWPKESTYSVDSNYYGNVTHFINHSCNPNVVSLAVIIDSADTSLHRIAFFALRDIAAGEELCLNYAGNFYKNEDARRKQGRKTGKSIPNAVNSSFKCMCGDKVCQGFIRFRE